MSAIKDVCTFKKRPRRENITPYRLSVAVLIYEFFKYRESAEFLELDESVRRHFIKLYCLLVLRLLQNPGLSLDNFFEALHDVDHVANAQLVLNVKSSICDIVDQGVHCLLDIIDAMGRLPIFEENTINNVTIHIRNNVVGYSIRRFIIYFDQLSFSEATGILDIYKSYVKSSALYHMQRGLKRVLGHYNNWHTYKDQWSRKQAERFVFTQGALLQNSKAKALSPVELQKQILNILESNPDLSEAYFVNYLNYLRIKDISGAMDSLYLSFDKTACLDGKANEDKSKGYRFAALNLAMLNYDFKHKEDALTALRESVRLAQEANDNVCLQHALSWLYCISDSSTDKLIEHSILKSLEINMSYVMSLGILSFGHYGGITCGNPKQIFETVTRSDAINSQHGHRDLIAYGFTEKSALWQFYGKVDMSALWSQLLLNYSTTDRSLSSGDCEVGLCENLCNIASHMFLEGNHSCANALYNFIKEGYPADPESNNWMTMKCIFDFTYQLGCHNCVETEIIAEKYACVNKWDACLRLAELYLHQQDYNRAHYCVNKILIKCQDKRRIVRIDVQVKAMILLIKIQAALSVSDVVPYGVLALLNSTLAYCKDFHLSYFISLVEIHLANIELLLGIADEALHTLNWCLPLLYTNGGVYDRAQATLVYIKCYLAVCGSKTQKVKRVYTMINLLEELVDDFTKLEVVYGVGDVLYLLAILCDDINDIDRRNMYAEEYKIHDEKGSKYKPNYISLLTVM